MINAEQHKKRILSQSILAALMVVSGSSALGQTVTLQNDQVQISGGSGTTFSAQSPTISSLGEVQTVVDVPTTNGVGIPSFSFNMVPNALNDGTYTYKVAVVFQQVDTQRRMEAEISNLQLTVSGGVITNGTIPGGQNMRVLGRNNAGTLQVQVNVANNTTNGPVTLNGGAVTFSASSLITRLRANSTFDTIILSEFDQPASYDYRIVVEQISGPSTIQFGTGTTFTAFPKVLAPACAVANCVNNNEAFLLNSNELATHYTNGYTVTGRFNVVTASTGSTGGGSTTVNDVNNSASNVSNAVNNLDVNNAGEVSTVLNNTTTLVSNLSTLLSGSNASSVSSSQALEFLSTATNALSKTSTATSSTLAANTEILKGISSAISSLSSRTDLTTEQKTTLTNLVSTTVSSSTTLIKNDSPRSQVLGSVDSISTLLTSLKGTGTTIPDTLRNQAAELGKSAGVAVTNSLPSSITGGSAFDVNSIDSINALKALAVSKPAVTQIIEKAAPKLCEKEPNLFLELLNPGLYYSKKQEYDDCISSGGIVDDSIIFDPDANGSVLAATAEKPVVLSGNANLVQYAGNKYPASASSLRISSDLLSDGFYTLADGRTLYVNNGRSMDLTGDAMNPVAMNSAISNAGFTLSGQQNGSLQIDLGSAGRFAGAFALSSVGSAGTTCDSVTFAAPTGNPTSSDYVFTMTCNDGLVQRITPFPDSSVFFDTVINAGFNLSTDRNTGVISIEGVGNVRPSFFVTPLTLADTAYLNANKTTEGIAVRSSDVNGDGKVDFEVISDNGVQVMYGL